MKMVELVTCYSVESSDGQQQHHSEVDVPLQGQLDEERTGVHVHL